MRCTTSLGMIEHCMFHSVDIFGNVGACISALLFGEQRALGLVKTCNFKLEEDVSEFCLSISRNCE